MQGLMVPRLAALTLVSALLIPTQAKGQVEIRARDATITVGGILHTQLTTSTVEDSDPDIFMRRARLYVGVVVNDFLEGRLQTDFSGGSTDLLDAYMRLNFSDRFRVTMGQFKRAFDLFEVSSSTRLSIIERDGRVGGVSTCEGPGGVCSFSRLTEELGYSGRDIGLKIDGALTDGITYSLTATNGTGINVPDENAGKSFSGRVGVEVADGVTVGANLGVHDYLDGTDDTHYGVAFGGDVDIGGWQDGLHLQLGVVAGDNWKSLDAAGDAANFLTTQAVATYYLPLTQSSRFAGIEPVARISWGDPDTSVDDDGGLLVTPGLMLYVVGRNKIGFNWDIYSPQTGGTESSFKFQTFLYF